MRETSFRLLDYVTARGQLLYYLSIILRRAQFRRPPGEGWGVGRRFAATEQATWVYEFYDGPARLRPSRIGTIRLTRIEPGIKCRRNDTGARLTNHPAFSKPNRRFRPDMRCIQTTGIARAPSLSRTHAIAEDAQRFVRRYGDFYSRSCVTLYWLGGVATCRKGEARRRHSETWFVGRRQNWSP